MKTLIGAAGGTATGFGLVALLMALNPPTDPSLDASPSSRKFIPVEFGKYAEGVFADEGPVHRGLAAISVT